VYASCSTTAHHVLLCAANCEYAHFPSRQSWLMLAPSWSTPSSDNVFEAERLAFITPDASLANTVFGKLISTARPRLRILHDDSFVSMLVISSIRMCVPCVSIC
jgi:hypothetical protein